MPFPKFLQSSQKSISNSNVKSNSLIGGSATQSRRLGYRTVKQVETNWCWAAVSLSMSKYYNPSSKWTQCSIANAALNRSDCCSSSSSCNQQWQLDIALSCTGNFAALHVGSMTFNQVCAQIDQDRPVGCLINWDRDGNGHFVSIYGYIAGSSGTHYIDVSDPIYLDTQVNIDEFASQYKGGADWNYAFLTRPAVLGGAVASLTPASSHPDLLGG